MSEFNNINKLIDSFYLKKLISLEQCQKYKKMIDSTPMIIANLLESYKWSNNDLGFVSVLDYYFNTNTVNKKKP